MATHIKNLWSNTNHWKDGSIIVATGAGSGICRSVILKYAQRNCSFVLGDINVEGLNEVKMLLERKRM